MVCVLQKVKAIVRCTMRHHNPETPETNIDLSLWLLPYLTCWLGVIRSTRRRARRKGMVRGRGTGVCRGWFVAENQGWSGCERGLLLMWLKRQGFVLGLVFVVGVVD